MWSPCVRFARTYPLLLHIGRIAFVSGSDVIVTGRAIDQVAKAVNSGPRDRMFQPAIPLVIAIVPE